MRIVSPIPIDEDMEHYVVQECDSGDIQEALGREILDADPNSDISNNTDDPFPHISWIKHLAQVTMVLPQFNNKPKQGRLIHDKDSDSDQVVKIQIQPHH